MYFKDTRIEGKKINIINHLKLLGLGMLSPARIDRGVCYDLKQNYGFRIPYNVIYEWSKTHPSGSSDYFIPHPIMHPRQAFYSVRDLWANNVIADVNSAYF